MLVPRAGLGAPVGEEVLAPFWPGALPTPRAVAEAVLTRPLSLQVSGSLCCQQLPFSPR